jgi:hypothetical protein
MPEGGQVVISVKSSFEFCILVIKPQYAAISPPDFNNHLQFICHSFSNITIIAPIMDCCGNYIRVGTNLIKKKAGNNPGFFSLIKRNEAKESAYIIRLIFCCIN